MEVHLSFDKHTLYPEPSTINVLLVEDNPGDARLVKELLLEEGANQFSLKHVQQLDEAFQHLVNHQLDLVLLDLSLPDGQGLDTLMRTATACPNIPIIVLTGLDNEAIAVQALRNGAQDYLVKGEMDGKLLVRAIRYAIERNILKQDLKTRTQELEEREANFRNAIATNLDGTIVLDINGNICFANPAAEVLFDCSAEELMGESFGYSVTPGENRNICIIRQGKEAATAEIRIAHTHWQGEPAYLVSLRDITLRQQAEERQSMQFAVTRVLEQESRVEEAWKPLLEFICKGVGWVFGEVWLLTPDKQKLYLGKDWHQESLSAPDFKASSRNATFLRGQSLPGRVWESGQPVWITNVIHETNFFRAKAAIQDGFHSAFAFPIRNGNKFMGVMAFYSRDVRQPDANLLEIVTDISSKISNFIQRKLAEAALIEQQSFLTQVIDSNPNLIFVKDQEGKFVLVNKALIDFYDTTVENLIGKTDADFNPNQEEVKQLIQDDLEVMTTLQDKFILEEKITDANGEVHWLQTLKKPLISSDGKSYQVLGVATDITERKIAQVVLQKINEDLENRVEERTAELKQINHELRWEIVERTKAESQLRTSEKRFRQLIEQAADAFFLHDIDGQLITVNQQACDSLGYRREELLNLNIKDIEENFLSNQVVKAWKEIIPGIPITVQGIHKRKDGSSFPVEVRIGRLELDGRDLILALARDTTERLRAETEIRNALEKEKQLSDFKSRFITIASHEFRTPLTTILAAAESLEYYGYKWDENKKLNYLHRIQNSVKHMTQLLNDVLIIAKAEAGKLEFNPTPLNLLEFCQELIEEMRLGDGSQHEIIFTHSGSNLDTALMDEKLLRHIFSNLLSNAIKYSPSGSNIDFQLACENQTAVFQVKDRGIGVPPEDIELMFDSFHRSKNVGNSPGTGLGLAIVKNAITIHGGTITVDSEVGIGTTFTVHLPLR